MKQSFNRLRGLILLCLLVTSPCFGIVNLAKPGVIWEVESGSTAANVNGGGFDILNANFPTDLACTVATGNNPICTSATYGNFVAADNTARVFVKQGTAHWTPGFYTLVDECVSSVWAQSVGVGACTTGQGLLDATIGHAVQPYDVVTLGVSDANSTGFTYNAFVANTAAGVSDQVSPAGGTFGIDYSQQAAARKSYADLGCTTATLASCSSVGAPFSVKDQGNLLHDTTTGTGAYCLQGWYEIVSVLVAAATLDRIATDGVHACVAGQFYEGGAVPLGSSTTNQTDPIFLQQAMATNGIGANHIFIKAGTYALSAAIASLTAGGTQAPVIIEGYNALRGDTPTGSNRPTLNGGISANLSMPSYWSMYNMGMIGTDAGTLLATGTGSMVVNCKVVQSTATAGKAAISLGGSLINSEVISYRGPAITTSGGLIQGSYLHDSDTLVTSTGLSNPVIIEDSILESPVTAAYNGTGADTGLVFIKNSTLFGGITNKTGTGIALATGTLVPRVENSIITGFATGISHADTQTGGYSDYIDLYNNTSNFSSGLQWQTQRHTYYVNPTFAGVAQVVGTGATTANGSPNTLIDSTVDFSLQNIQVNQDFVYISSTSGTAGKYLITAIGGTGNHQLSLDLAPGASSSNVAYQITTGHNFAVGNARLKTGGFPGAFPASPAVSTGYFGIGAVQPSGAGGGGQHNTGY